MTILNVIRMGHPTLRQVAKPVSHDKIGTVELNQLIVDMRETLAAYGGIGLAAPQVDVSLQLAVVQVDKTPTRYGDVTPIEFSVYINPVVTILDDNVAGYWEGCLSIPGMRGFVERPQHIQIDYLDQDGQACQRIAMGFQATLFQHEFDHLAGKLYVDRLQDTRLFSFDDEFEQHLDKDD